MQQHAAGRGEGDAKRPVAALLSMPRPNLTGWRIWIDAGHGGRPPTDWCDAFGTAGELSGPEKDVNLLVSLALQAILQQWGATVAMTRTTDEVVCLDDRFIAASAWRPDVLVSVHHNGGPPEDRGTETLWFHPQSEPLAAAVQRRLVEAFGLPDRGTPFRDDLIMPTVEAPSIITEAMFMTNPDEDRLLADAATKVREAEAIAAGIADYIQALGSRR